MVEPSMWFDGGIGIKKAVINHRILVGKYRKAFVGVAGIWLRQFYNPASIALKASFGT